MQLSIAPPISSVIQAPDEQIFTEEHFSKNEGPIVLLAAGGECGLRLTQNGFAPTTSIGIGRRFEIDLQCTQ